MVGSGVVRRFSSAAAGREALLVGRGRLAVDPDALPGPVRQRIKDTFGEDIGAEEVVRRIIVEVQKHGDAALRQYTQAFDQVDVRELQVSEEQIDAAVARVGEDV